MRVILPLFIQTCATALAQPDGNPTSIQENAQFAFALYKEVAHGGSGNVLVSPWSVTCALVAARLGADGDTAAEISKAVGLAPSTDAVVRGFGQISQRLVEIQKGGGLTLRRATAIWCRPNQPLRGDFVQSCRGTLGARVFDSGLDSRAIDQWVSELTMGKIQWFLGREGLSDMSSLVLVNALYYRGHWRQQFARKATTPGKFRLKSGSEVQVPMMRGQQSAGYCLYQGAKVLELPYQGNGVVMLVVLPTEATGLETVERALSGEWLIGCQKSLKASKVDVVMPTFTMLQSTKLDAALQHLGIVKAFTRKADFSGIDGNHTNLWINTVIQKAFLDVNEEGTEAAAATGAHIYYASSASVESFVCDRPFLFMIYAARAPAVLFIGRVGNPVEPQGVSDGF
jgi:serpin B